MTESIGTKLVSVISPIIPVYLSESEVDAKPYCTYDLTVMERRTKDGVYKISGDVTVRVVSDNFDEADTLLGRIEAAIAAGMAGPQYVATMQRRTKDCVEGNWTLETVYLINQFS